ncbi:MAG: hypothetical protein K9L17_04660 [Clostridiales bacterium]|nr:hypothetical protein [Clostridiales bacterium]MCF8021966.1 hypothetical protein [Clostridiales bacterium]
MKYSKVVLVLIFICLVTVIFPEISLAVENPDITAGLEQVDANTLANKILKIALGVGALSGVVAATILILLGFKLKTGNERTRSDTKEHIMYVFIGLGLTGLAVLIVGFFSFLIKGAGA